MQRTIPGVPGRDSAGYTFTLQIISSNTVSHLVDALRGTALRAGILLDCRIVEYVDPELWLGTNAAMLTDDPPNATLGSRSQDPAAPCAHWRHKLPMRRSRIGRCHTIATKSIDKPDDL